MKAILQTLKSELETELSRILAYWSAFSPDHEYGGFKGRLDNNNIPDPTAPKGLVLNARILWTFSAAYNARKDKAHLVLAQRAYDYIVTHFYDRDYGGYYWSLENTGAVKEDKKHVYGIAFCLYGFAEYYKATAQPVVLENAKACYNIIEKNSFDDVYGGYLEAFTREWRTVADLRLSAKDANEKKTMNTHLHIIEAYSNLFHIWQDEELKQKIALLLKNFQEKIIDPYSGHLHLFFKEDWTVQSSLVSYGHDIEAAWLLEDAAAIIGDKHNEKISNLSNRLAQAAKEGLDAQGGLWYEKDNDVTVREKHWWPQAEAMVGFFNAWQHTGDKEYLDAVINTWDFIKRVLIDKENGEWFWGIASADVMMDQDKLGFWKCPYHNTRACLELIRRIDIVLN
jgi:mannobiose 2-epimerase